MKSLAAGKARSAADILWNVAEEEIAALFEDYGSLIWNDMTPAGMRPDVMAVNRKMWRDVNVVLTSGANLSAKRFIDFLTCSRSAAILRAEGWSR